MPTPFPGMDPYLERPNLWPNVHNSLITALRDYLSPLLRPRYFVSVQERSYLDDPLSAGISNIPDVGVIGPLVPDSYQQSATPVVSTRAQTIELPMPERIRETYLEVQEVGGAANIDVELNGLSDSPKVVTLIEILSPWNKRATQGRTEYIQKRKEILYPLTNLVEINLLRAGKSMTQLKEAKHDYSILVSPSMMRPRARFIPFSVRQSIPDFQLPLTEDDEWPVVDLNTILHELYDRAGYDLRINYRSEPVPALDKDDAVWMDKLLQEKNLR